MTNKEKFKDEIVEIACKRERVAVSNGKITSCAATLCSYCDLKNSNRYEKNDAYDCTRRLNEWLEEEYVDIRIMNAEHINKFGGVSKGDKVWVSDDINDTRWQERTYICTYKDSIITFNEESGIVMTWKYIKAPVKGGKND